MNRPRATLLAAALVVATTSCTSVTPRYPEGAMRVAALVGGRLLDDDAEPLEEQPAAGLELDWMTSDPGWRWELGVGYSSEDDTGGDASLGSTDAELTMWDIYVGTRWLVSQGRLRPYIGGGFSIALAELEVSGAGSPSDASFGAYLHAGITLDLTRHLFVGLDLRGRAGTEFDFDDNEVDGFYQQAAVVLGYLP